MSLTAILSIAYIVIVLAVGYISTIGKKGEVREFFVAGNQLPWLLLMPFLMAESITGGTTVGVAEKVHQSGITALMYYVGSPLGLCLLAFGFAKIYHAMRKITVGEVLGALFDEKTRLAYSVIVLTIGTIGSGTAALSLGVVVAPMLGISYDQAIWGSMAFLVILALFGLRGQAWMNVIHLGGILFTFIPLAIAALIKAGGFSKIAAAIPTGHLNPMAAGLPTIIAWITASTIIKLVSLTAVTATFAAKEVRDAKIGCVGAGFLVLGFVWLPGIMALAGYVLTPGIESRHTLWEVSRHMGEWATTLASIGVIAAIISTTPAVLLARGATVARDICLKLKPNLSDKVQILISRTSVVAIGFGSLAASIIATEQSGGILAFIFQSVQARCVIVLPLLISVLWRRLNATVSFWATVLGVTVGFVWIFAGSPFGVEVLWVSMGVALVVLIAGSLIAKPAHLRGAEGLVPATNPGTEDSGLH